MLACGSYIRFRSSIFLSLPSPLLDSEASSVPQQRSAPDENANPAGRIPRSIREVERRNTIAGIALPPPPPRRGTILGGGGTGRCTAVYRDKDRIGGCDGTAERRPSRLPPTFVNHAAESKTSAGRKKHAPSSSVRGRDDGPRRRRRRRRRAYKQTITRETFGIHSPCSGPLLPRIPSTEWRRARGRICGAE